ncbi:FYVE, RhoGEF and PH domain-containing protein 5-like [Hoplias malabaricus]|uniref:FYVE, RhoGEF and PH domain-containing protein 5-like n=1 Tax=Hoplias malabaricus TaxID=27720 RepID=UPI003462B3B0
MSAELQKLYLNSRSQVHVCLPKGQHVSVVEKSCHHQGCKPSITPKPRSNSKHFHHSNNYLRKHSNKNLRPAVLEQCTQKIYKKDLLHQWEESRQKDDLEQKREESITWKDVRHKESTMQWEEFMEANKKEQNDSLEQGEDLGCGEELAQGTDLDWEVGLDQGKGFDSEEGEGSVELLPDSCSDGDEEVQGVARQLYREEEGWEVVRNGKTGSCMTPIDVHFARPSPLCTHYEQKTYKDGLNRNKTQTSGTLSDKMYSDQVFHDQMFSNGLYSNNIYSNGVNSGDLCPDRIDTVTMLPDMCDAGEALADADGLSECDLFEQTELAPTLEIEEELDPCDTLMLPVEERSESSNGSLSTFGEECCEVEDERAQKELGQNSSEFLRNTSQDINSTTSLDSPHSDSTFYPRSEREAGILSESSHQPSSSFSSFCSSESEVPTDEVGTESIQSHCSDQDKAEPETENDEFSRSKESEFKTAFELGLQCVSSPILPEDPKSNQMQSDGQEEEKPNAQEGQSVMSTECSAVYTEEHVYEETEPKFQPKGFLQSRKYLMTRSISVEPPCNRLNPMSCIASGKDRLMLHPQSYYTSQNFLGESLPALTGSLGCLSPGGPCPSSGLGITNVDIPPPFELSSITRRPIRKSTPALPTDVTASCRKLDFGFKRYFLPLWFLRKSERRGLADNRSVSSRSSSESSPQGSCKRLNLIKQNMGSPELYRAHDCSVPSSPSSFLYQKIKQKPGLSTHHNSAMSAIPRSWDLDDFLPSPIIKPRPLSKPRSFSSPNVDSSVYENVFNPSPHYENVQLRLLNPSIQSQPKHSSANDTDGYVDMSSLPGFQSKSQSSEQETESAYTICSPAVMSDGSVGVSVGEVCTKKEEKKAYERLTVTFSRAFYSAKELLDSEAQHVKTLKLLSETVAGDERLVILWSDLPVIYTLHQELHSQLETRIKQWDQKEGIADIILAKKTEFSIFSSFVSQYDGKMKTLEQMENTQDNSSVKQQLLQVIVRVLQYRMLLKDYLNNLSPEANEYKDTQEALAVFTDIADQAKEDLKNGVDLLHLVHVEHSVLGLKNLLQSGRVFVKEGTLMKVSRKCRQPRHLFLMSDIMLYTYPQQDGKYRLINTLTLTGMEVTKLVMENAQNALKIEVKDISITLSASCCIERDDWFVTLNRAIADLGSLLGAPTILSEFEEKSGACLGENAPSLVSVSQVAVCMSCPVRFSLTHRRHHCHACGKVVCRNCCRNKVPLKYKKNRRAKVCDKCYSELHKPDGDVATATESSSRPLSAVFQNIHPTCLWRGRKGHMSFNQVSEGEISGTLQRSRNSRRSWKSLWFLLKDKVLYTYPEPEDRIACESLPLLGFSVRSETEGESSVFQLYHKTTLYYTFKAQDTHTAQRWVSAMEEATVL